ncbi:MAG: ABC transporter ATP-binding protein [Pseudomonadales bacterium]|nr:ABC transporter ATP-binding protein [Pseudomonadales bacterium]
MNPSAGNSVVQVNQLSRKFGKTDALVDVNLQLNEGIVYGLVGANGAGKTTLIKHLLGLLRCQQGSVRVFANDPIKNPQAALSHIGYLSEDRDIPDWMTIVEFCDYVHAFHPSWDSNYAKELLNTFELDSSKVIKNLSRGMRAQVALIGAVAHKPDLLILDEPSSGLDAIVRKDILNAVVRTISEEGRTVLFSSHLLEEVERLSDHVIMIQDGRVALDESLESLGSSHHYTELRFRDNLASFPALEATISTVGEGRSWNVIHHCSLDQISSSIQRFDGEVVSSRHATLEEIFVARVGRVSKPESVQLT